MYLSPFTSDWLHTVGYLKGYQHVYFFPEDVVGSFQNFQEIWCLGFTQTKDLQCLWIKACQSQLTHSVGTQ